MKKIMTAAGHIAYEITAVETVLIGGIGICDSCGQYAPTGYLLPVLNSCYCTVCFKDFCDRARYYPTDKPHEGAVAAYYESKIPLETEASHAV